MVKSETLYCRLIGIDTLLSSDSEVIFRYAWKLLVLLIQIEGQTEALVSLRAASRARYFSRARANSATDNSWVTPRPATEGTPGLMVFIIGPPESFATGSLNTPGYPPAISSLKARAIPARLPVTIPRKDVHKIAALKSFHYLCKAITYE